VEKREEEREEERELCNGQPYETQHTRGQKDSTRPLCSHPLSLSLSARQTFLSHTHTDVCNVSPCSYHHRCAQRYGRRSAHQLGASSLSLSPSISLSLDLSFTHTQRGYSVITLDQPALGARGQLGVQICRVQAAACGAFLIGAISPSSSLSLPLSLLSLSPALL
jgi:hypothetical protein